MKILLAIVALAPALVAIISVLKYVGVFFAVVLEFLAVVCVDVDYAFSLSLAVYALTFLGLVFAVDIVFINFPIGFSSALVVFILQFS